MKLFIDSADPSEIRQALEIWPVDGVTTNPTLLARGGGDPHQVLTEIAGLVAGPIAAEVVAGDWEGIVEEGEALARLADNIVIKIPVSADGLRATMRLSEKGIDTVLTLVFSPAQALLCARAGATYVCPFVGRLDDVGQVGTELVGEIMAVYSRHSIATRVVAASIRNPLHVMESALHGAYAATVPLKVIRQMIEHPLTTRGIELFLADWEKARKKK